MRGAVRFDGSRKKPECIATEGAPAREGCGAVIAAVAALLLLLCCCCFAVAALLLLLLLLRFFCALERAASVGVPVGNGGRRTE